MVSKKAILLAILSVCTALYAESDTHAPDYAKKIIVKHNDHISPIFMWENFVYRREKALHSPKATFYKTCATILGSIPGDILLALTAWYAWKNNHIAWSDLNTSALTKRQTPLMMLQPDTKAKTLTLLAALGALVLTGIGSAALYKATKKIIRQQIDYSILKSIVDGWPKNKHKIHRYFHYLMEFYKRSPEKFIARNASYEVDKIVEAFYFQYNGALPPKAVVTMPTWLTYTLVAIGIAIVIKILASTTKDYYAAKNHKANIEKKNIITTTSASFNDYTVEQSSTKSENTMTTEQYNEWEKNTLERLDKKED